jgi:hypothetical protein
MQNWKQAKHRPPLEHHLAESSDNIQAMPEEQDEIEKRLDLILFFWKGERLIIINTHRWRQQSTIQRNIPAT